MATKQQILSKQNIKRCWLVSLSAKELSIGFRGLYQRSEDRVLAEQGGVARHQHLATGTGDGDVELAVYCTAILHEAVAGEEVELVAEADGETVDDDIALRPLIALHGVDGDTVESGNLKPFYLLAYHRDLVAIGHDDAYRLIAVEAGAVEAVDAAQEVGDNLGFGGVYLVGVNSR